MASTGTSDAWLGGTMRLTRVTDHLAHVLEHSQVGETSGTWTGLCCPDHGLRIGSDAGNVALLRLAGQDQIADFVREAPADFTAEHGQLGAAGIQAHLSGGAQEGERLWQQLAAMWCRRRGRTTARCSRSTAVPRAASAPAAAATAS